jgi:hypothetical protein
MALANLMVEKFLGLREKRMIFIGGLPRSGTTSCDSFFHAQEGCFVFDEYHPIKSEEFLNQLERDRSYGCQQRKIWTDSSGRDWRGFNTDDYLNACLSVLLLTLREYTKKEKFKYKDLSKVCVLATKLPHIEDAYCRIRDELSNYGVETHFIYCVRDPVASLSSNWQMPWVTTDDPAVFARSYLSYLENSLRAMENIPSSECSVWITPQNQEMRNDPRARVQVDNKIKSWVGSLNSKPVYSDEWPKERRVLRQLPENIIHEFSASGIAKRFREKFFFSG